MLVNLFSRDKKKKGAALLGEQPIAEDRQKPDRVLVPDVQPDAESVERYFDYSGVIERQ